MRRILRLALLALSLFLTAAPTWPEPVRITGRIVPPGVPGARVELRGVPRARGATGQPEPLPVTARPAADGTFELKAPEPGLYRLTVQSEGFLSSEVVPVLEETDLPIWLQPAGTAREAARRPAAPGAAEIRRGRVLDSVTQAPLPGALVWQAGLGTEEDVPWTWTAADGTFRLTLRGPDPAVGAAAVGHVPISHFALGSGRSVALKLLPAGTLAGQIVDAEGRPVAGATVSASPTDPGLIGRPDEKEARVGAEGRFLLRGLTPETGYRLFVKAEGFVPAWEEAVLGKPGQGVPPVRIVLSRGVTFTGRIVDPAGQPVAGADLALSIAAEGPEGTGFSMSTRVQASSDSTGRFRFQQVGKGAYSLQVVHPGFAPAYRSGTVGARRRPVVDIGDLTLEPGASLEGRVLDPSGAPVEGAQVFVSERPSARWTARMPMSASNEGPALTGPDGFFRIADLEDGQRFDLSVDKPGYVLARVPGVEAPTQEPLQIELRPAQSLSGRVLDGERRPVGGAWISLVEVRETGFGDDSSLSRSSRGAGQTDEEGRFVLSQLEPGPLHLEVRAPGFRTAELSGLRIAEGEEPSPLEIVLEKGAVLEGRVLDGNGQPVRQARIHVFFPDSRRFFGPSHRTDDRGHFQIAGLAAGEHRVTAEPLGSGLRAEGKVVLGDSGTYHLDLRLPFGVDVSGHVVGEQGEPLRGAWLSLHPIQEAEPRPGASARSAADGSFRFRDIPDGLYRLNGSAPGHIDSPTEDEVLVAGREVGGLVLRLGRGGTITGRILGVAGEETGLLRIEALREDSGESRSTAGHDMTYRISVAPGTWRVTAFLPSGLSATGTVSVGAGEEAVLDLEMPRGLTLSGRVLLDGQPLAGADVLVAGSPGPGAEGALPTGATTRYDGSFSVPGLRPGPAALSVVSRGLYHSRRLDLTASRTITVEIFTGQISGHVLSSTGEPVAGVLISLRGEDRETGAWAATAQASTDERGAFELPRLAAGSYRITAQAQGFAQAAQSVVVAPGGTTEIQVVLEPQ